MQRGSLRELATLFLRLGSIAFGGPAAHIALMEDEFVERRAWLDRRHFLDLIGATNLIPGPNSTEVAIHLGYERAGYPGLLVAGLGFIAPAAILVTVLAWGYVEFGTTPAVEALLYGIEPVMIAIVVHALVRLAPAALSRFALSALAIGVLAAYLFGINELLLLFGAGLFYMVAVNAARVRANALLVVLPLAATAAPPPDVDLTRMFLLFLKIGAVLYGSGYVLLAFLRGEFVDDLGWLTEQQLIDAVAIGQLTPGPVSTTATFIGYVLAGVPGAVLATVAIFLPSFVFVALSNPIIPKLRRSVWFSALLDGVNAAALALMGGVTIQLGMAAVVDWWTALIGIVAALLLFATRINNVWLIAGGALVGLLTKGVLG
ncbi:MAG: chromate efflux transporter [Actinomycetota bacterium]